jgi:hypothetical protein
MVGKIGYDTEVTKAQLVGKSIVEYTSNGLKDQIVCLWESVSDALTNTTNKKESK